MNCYQCGAELNEKDFKRGLKSAAPWLRHELGSALQLRYTPELIFELDHSIEYGAHISSMLKDLVPAESENSAEDADSVSAEIDQ